MLSNKLARLICALRPVAPLQAASLQRMLVFAADYQYYRGIPIKIPMQMYSALNKAIDAKQPAPFTYEQMVEAVRADGRKAIKEILQDGAAKCKGYTQAEHYITPHWENAVYYATYMTEKRLGNAEPMLPLVVGGIVDDRHLILDWHEQRATAIAPEKANQTPEERASHKFSPWPTKEEILSNQLSPRAEEWMSFMYSQFGPAFEKYLVKFPEYKTQVEALIEQMNGLRKSMKDAGGDKELIKQLQGQNKVLTKQLDQLNAEFFEKFARDPEIIQHSLSAVHEDTKQQVRLPTDVLADLPVNQVFIGMSTPNDEIEWVQVTEANVDQLLDKWSSVTKEKFKELKERNQKFHGMDEGFTSKITF